MISIFLGNVGSGKTASAVYDLLTNNCDDNVFTNIELNTKIPHVKDLKPEMIFKLEWDEKKQKDMPVSVNKDFWRNLDGSTSVILDEVHTLLNARKPGAKVNIIMTDWLALIRRVLGSVESGEGHLVMISQIQRRIDVIAREMANVVKYHTCHYTKTCPRCRYSWPESSATPEPVWKCPLCGSKGIKKHHHIVEVHCFTNISDFNLWDAMGFKTWYDQYYIMDIENVFNMYNTKSWDNLLSEYY